MKVLLNSPCNYYTSVEILTNSLGLSYIKAHCENRNRNVSIQIVPNLDRQILEREKPDIVGLSSYAATYGRVVDISRLCREMGIKVVVGGEQITTLPHLLTADMDIGVLGEGEYAFEQLLRYFDNGWDTSSLMEIPGLVFYGPDGKLKASGPCIHIKSLDDLPIPDLLLGNEDTDTLCLMTSRGCPYRCVFCATGWHKNVRWFSPGRVIETIKFHTDKYPGIRRIKFWDDLFTVNTRRIEEIVVLLEANGLTEKVNYSIATRTDHINEELLHLLRRMNCIHVSMGMESGSEKTLAYIKKGLKVEANRKAAELLHKHRLYSEASFIIGFPYETEEDILQTYSFIKSIPLSKVQIFLPVPYPGTGLWDYALQKSLVTENGMNWEALDLIATMYKPRQVLDRFVVLSEKLSRKHLYLLLKKFGRLAKFKTFQYALVLLIRNPEIIFSRLRREIKFVFINKKRT